MSALKRSKKKKAAPFFSGITNYLKKMGPGFIVGASDNDPSGIATYSQAGAQFGLATLWMALFTLPLIIAVQEMCARIGIVTEKGLTYNIKKHYPKPLLWLLILFSFPAFILNIAADIASIGAVANMLMPSVSAALFSILFTFILLLGLVFLSYQKIVLVLKYLCLTLLVYFIIPFLCDHHWRPILKQTILPTFQFNKDFISIIVAILGTTISPYLFFWQATMEAENTEQHQHRRTKIIIKNMHQDVALGMLSSNLGMYFIILTTGTVLFQGNIHHITTVQQAAKALEPLAGNLSYLLFAIGVLGTGILSIPILCGCLSYILAVTFNWQGGFDKQVYKAKCFYFVVFIALLVSLVIALMGLSPIKALIYTAILYGITTPVLLVMILHLCNNKTVMGSYTNSKQSNILGVTTILLMGACEMLLLIFQFI